MIHTAYLARCDNRKSMPQTNPQAGAPEQWLDNNILRTMNLNGFSFDFFIDWANNTFTPEIWFKVIYTQGGECTIEQFIQDITDCCSWQYFYNLYEFSQRIGSDFYFILFNDEQNWSDNNSFLYKVKLTRNNNNYTIDSFNRLTINDFKQNIINLSGGPIQIGSKGLMYGTSRLECHLSHTTSLYPGDADLILTNTNHEPIAILEFKKHNLDTNMENENIHNYYPSRDKRKYDRLAIMQNYISQMGFNVPLLVLYYPTKTMHTKWKLEQIEYQNDNFTVTGSELFPLPVIDNEENYRTVLHTILTKIQEWS